MMPLKKLDNRIRVLVENSVSLGHRSFFVIVGDHGRDQVSRLLPHDTVSFSVHMCIVRRWSSFTI